MAVAFSRALVAVVLGTAAACALAAAGSKAGNEATRNPIQFPGTPWAFDGFLVIIPPDEGWSSLAKDAHYADLTKDYCNGVQAAIVVEARPLEEPLTKEEELLKVLREDQTTVPAASMKLLDYTAEPFAPKGALCARFSAKFDDRRSTFDAPGMLLIRGVACVPPSTPKAIVTLRSAQRSSSSEWAPAVSAATDPVLESLHFVATLNPAIQQARDAVRGDKPGTAVAMLAPSA